jgi:hypothetical protein
MCDNLAMVQLSDVTKIGQYKVKNRICGGPRKESKQVLAVCNFHPSTATLYTAIVLCAVLTTNF